MVTINVVDSMMGSGKSQYAIQHMNEAKEESFIYITPYLDEVKRIKENCKDRTFHEPKENKEKFVFTKSKALKNLLMSGKDIATTHSLFKLIDEETEEILRASNYTLVLDEVMDVVQQIPLSKADQELLFVKSNILKINEETGQILLGDDANQYLDSGSGKFSELIHMAKLGRIFKFQDTVILWEFPASVFKYFKEVYILTYLFDGQIQKYFFDFYEVNYNRFAVIKDGEKYKLTDYDASLNSERIDAIKSKIEIYEGKLNAIGKVPTALSYNWYKEASGNVMEILQNNIYNYFKNINKSKVTDVLWTSFKEKLNVPSYKRAFIPHNMRATNEYSNTHTLAYCVNRYISPYMINYFKTKNIEVNQDIFALSELLQWIFRSRIRNNEAIRLYVPSERMRVLLQSYLDKKLP